MRTKTKHLKKTFYGICAYYNYKVKIQNKGSIFCGIDFEGDAKYEDYREYKQKIINGGDLLKLWSVHFSSSDICDFVINGQIYHFGFFDSHNGSFSDIDYTILEEKI